MQELEKILEEIEMKKKKCLDIVRVEIDPMEITIHREQYKGLRMAEDIIRKHMNDGWIPVEEALPDEEAEEYIKKKLHGIGYLYPCLVTYRSPMTERIHVVRFYYDIYEHWFVNAGEEVCEKERCIAWRPLPEPYRPERNSEE